MIDIDGKTYRNLEEQVEYLTEKVDEQSNDHNTLKNRDMADQHPIGAISGLQEKVNSFQTGITDNGTAITASNARITSLENKVIDIETRKLNEFVNENSTPSVYATSNKNQYMIEVGEMNFGIPRYDPQGHIEVNSAATDTQATNKGQVQSMISDKVIQVINVTVAEANTKQLTADNLNKIKANPYNCIINYQALQIIFQVGTVLTQSVSYESFSFQKAQVTGIEMINAHEIKIDLTTGKFEILQLPLQKLEEIVLHTPSGTITQEQRNMIRQNFYLVVVRIPYTNSQGVQTTLDFHPMEIKGDDYNFACIAVDNPEPNKSTLYEMTVNVTNGNYSTTDMIVESYITLRNDLATKAEVTQQIDNINAIQIWNKSTVNQGVIEATEATVQTVCTNYIVTNVGRQPKSRDGLIVTLTDQGNDKVQYIYTEASNEWIDTGKAAGSVDLSAYYTKTEADGKFALPSQIPTNNNQLQNGASYIKNEPNAYNYNNLANRPTIPAAQVNSDWNAVAGVAMILNKPTIPNPNNFVPKTDFTSMIYGTTDKGEQFTMRYNTVPEVGAIPRYSDNSRIQTSEPSGGLDCVNIGFANRTYAIKTEIPTKTTQLTNDSGFITNSPDQFSYNNLADKPIFPVVPTKTSQLQNDSNFITNTAGAFSYNNLSGKPTIPPPYTLPMASAVTLGGVKVSGKTAEDTQAVHVDGLGGLWTKPGGAANTKKWNLYEVSFKDMNDDKDFSTVLYIWAIRRLEDSTYSNFIKDLQTAIGEGEIMSIFAYDFSGDKVATCISEAGIIVNSVNAELLVEVTFLRKANISVTCDNASATKIYTIEK